MKHHFTSNNYSTRRSRRYPYPNEADPSYFTGRLLDVLTAFASCMGTITLVFYFMTL